MGDFRLIAVIVRLNFNNEQCRLKRTTIQMKINENFLQRYLFFQNASVLGEICSIILLCHITHIYL